MQKLQLDNKKIEQLIKEVIKILKKHVKQPIKVYLFGSLARKNSTPYSDIDLAFESKEQLNQKTIVKIKDEIDNLRTLRKIELIYLNESSSSLRRVVKKEGVLIYEFKG